MSYEFLRGAKIEFEETMMRSSFVVAKNPNAEASCGCGSSFSPKMK
jgi:iron-sulfur cluster assembly accessory protein